MVRVEEFSSFRELDDLRCIWDSILQKSKDNDVFSTWEWLSSWWEHFGKGRRLRVLVAREKDEIVGIAPLMLSNHDFMHFGGIREIGFIGSPQSDYNNLILLNNERECLKMFLNHIVSEHDWNILRLGDVREGTLSAKLLCEVLTGDRLKLQHRVTTLCPYITLPNTIEDFMKKLPSHRRKDIRRRLHRLRDKYLIEFKTYTDFNSIEEAMNVFCGLHQKRWKSKGKSGNLALRTVRDFHTAIARSFADKGWLSLYFLTANEEPVAAAYSFDYGQKTYAYLTGFDPRFAKYGVGSLLYMHAIEMSIRKRFKEFDLTRGYEPYKVRWSTEVRKNFEVELVREGLSVGIYKSRIYQLVRMWSSLARDMIHGLGPSAHGEE